MATCVARRLLREGNKLVFLSRNCQKVTPQKRSFSLAKCLASRFFTEKHEWVSLENGTGTVGISNYAQEQLGEIVYVEFPEVGSTLEAQDVSGCLESVKAASEIYCPVGGEVTEVNSALEDKPGLVNTSPLEEGWLFKLKLSSDVSTDGLMDEEAYNKFVGSLDH
ncbi:glycine cleavage system H protein [Aplysia californica]|uniref:Glycine cleavage system H protein n=1 Tax=Aplysia californica TaxID=6500 RepID=A0ABM0K030_APLCA|nr:glycine cleavage system H protein [Aplysia californica]